MPPVSRCSPWQQVLYPQPHPLLHPSQPGLSVITPQPCPCDAAIPAHHQPHGTPRSSPQRDCGEQGAVEPSAWGNFQFYEAEHRARNERKEICYPGSHWAMQSPAFRSSSLCPVGFPVLSFTFKTLKEGAGPCIAHGLLQTLDAVTKLGFKNRPLVFFFFLL